MLQCSCYNEMSKLLEAMCVLILYIFGSLVSCYNNSNFRVTVKRISINEAESDIF